jgi:hypothetical protein
MNFIGQVRFHLFAMGRDVAALDWWRVHRLGNIEAGLGELVSSSQVNAFVSDYATSLRKSLVQLFASNAWDVLEEIPMDYAEELLLQARSYAEMTKAQPAPCSDHPAVVSNLDLPNSECLLARHKSLAEAA